MVCLVQSRLLFSVAGVVAATAVLAGAQCPGPAADGTNEAPRCPSLAAVCPSLACVEHRRDDEGCPICECAVQACFTGADCAERGVDVVCDASSRFCEPGPGCTDGDFATPCPAACYGRCVYAGERTRTDGYCNRPDDCAPGESCHQTVCVDDPTTAGFFECVGWCVSGCPEVETVAFDPVNGFCMVLPDGCLPPGWTTEGC